MVAGADLLTSTLRSGPGTSLDGGLADFFHGAYDEREQPDGFAEGLS